MVKISKVHVVKTHEVHISMDILWAKEEHSVNLLYVYVLIGSSVERAEVQFL